MSSPQYPELPPHVPGARPPGAGRDAPGGSPLDELIARTARLRDDVDAARRGERAAGEREAAWERAVDRLDDAGTSLRELREQPRAALAGLGGRVGSAEWNLLTDGVVWSEETYALFGRTVAEGPLTLDELPSRVAAGDRPALTAAVTACLVDGRPLDCVFRVVRPDGTHRTVRLEGEPVLDEAGGTVAMWAMVRDVGESGPGGAAAEPRPPRRAARAGHAVTVRFPEPALAPWPGPAGGDVPARRAGTLEVAARTLPAGAGGRAAGKWCDVLELPGGGALLSVGDLTGDGPSAAARTAAALGAVRGIALTGTPPGELLGHLNRLLDLGDQPLLAGALICRYDPAGRRLTWAQAGHPAPVLCRGGTGWALPRPAGPLLGTVTDAVYAERTDRLEPDDVLVLHTDGLFSDIGGQGPAGHAGDARLTGLAPRLAAAGGAGACLRLIVAACGASGRDDDAGLLVARVGAGAPD